MNSAFIHAGHPHPAVVEMMMEGRRTTEKEGQLNNLQRTILADLAATGSIANQVETVGTRM
jgi:hypothetical protein